MNTILLFGAGKSSTVLIDFLIRSVQQNNWKLIIADSSMDQILIKTNNSQFAEAVELDIRDDEKRGNLIGRSTIVISMMPPSLHFLVAKDCVEFRKHLLTASYLDEQMKGLEEQIRERKLLFLCEMGLDPGIDHMSAMKIIESIKAEGGRISSFRSHCGGLVAPETDDNPWRYKISWNPRNIVRAGHSGAEYKVNGEVKKVAYPDLFDEANTISVDGLDPLVFYPNRDSLSYIPLYQLPTAATFMRTTLRYPDFFRGWKAVVKAGLTDDGQLIDTRDLSFAQWSAPVLTYINKTNRQLLEYLGLFDEKPVPAGSRTSADILQYLLETRLSMHENDKDMIVMLHELEYSIRGVQKKILSSLIVKGENMLRTAMAKTVGLPLGIAAELILKGKITLAGLYIPTIKEIYEPLLKELYNFGIRFSEISE